MEMAPENAKCSGVHLDVKSAMRRLILGTHQSRDKSPCMHCPKLRFLEFTFDAL
jgi:hypothetical protein